MVISDKTLYEDFVAWARKHNWFCIFRDNFMAEWVAPTGVHLTVHLLNEHVLSCGDLR